MTKYKRRSGHLIQIPDGRTVVRFNDQPLLKEHKKVVLHLLNEDYSLQKEGEKELTLVKTIEEYNTMIKDPGCKAIGMID